MATIPATNKRIGQYGANALVQSYSDMPLDLYGSLLGGSNSLSGISMDNSTLGLLAAAARGDSSASTLSSNFGADPSKIIDVSSTVGSTTSPDVPSAGSSSTSPDVPGAAGSSNSPDVPGSSSTSISPDFPDTPESKSGTTPDDANGYILGYRDPSKRPDLFGGGAPATTPDTGGGSTSPDVTGSTAPAPTSGSSGSSTTTSGKSSTSSESAVGLDVARSAAETTSLLSSPDEPITGSGMLGTARGGGIYPSANAGSSNGSGSTSTGSNSTSGSSTKTDAAATNLQSIFDSMQAPTSDALAADSMAAPTSAWDGLGGSGNSGHAMFETLPQNSVVDWSADTNVISAQLFPGY